jgi:hypothetical protein
MLCPNCQQPLPEPPERFCPNCGAEISAAAPGAPPPPPPPGAPATPWEQRDRIGLGTALVETTQQIFTRPTEFFRAMPVTGGLGSPLLYGVIMGYAGLLASAVYSAIFNAVAGPRLFEMSQRSEIEKLLPYLQGGMSLVMQVIFGPVMIAIGLFISAAVLHVLLMLFGGAPRGFEATFRVRCYAEAASLLRLIPGCGTPVFVIYILVLLILGLSEAHRVGRGRAAAAVLLPLFLLCCCCASGIVIALGGLASALGNIR